MSRSNPLSGDILICQSVSSHKGAFSSDGADSQLVMVYLGTVPDDTDPDAASRLRKLGWARTVVYEVQLHFGSADEAPWAHRWYYEADTPKDAALSAIRYASVIAKTVAEADEESRLLTLEVRIVELGKIDEQGNPKQSGGPPLVEWGHNAGSLEDLAKQVEEL